MLEHVSSPAAACEEIMRIGRRGYIETPARMSDVIFNHTRLPDHHRWQVEARGKTLIFLELCEKDKRDTGVDELYMMFQSEWKNPVQELVHNNRDYFVNMFLWDGRFDYIVISGDGRIIASTLK